MKENKSKIKDKPLVKNKCKICNWFEERADNEEYREPGGFFSSNDVQYLNNLLKQTDINTKNMLAINKAFNNKVKCTFSEYYYKHHKNKCLIDFQIVEEPKIENENVEIGKSNFDFTDFYKLSQSSKNQKFLELANCLLYQALHATLQTKNYKENYTSIKVFHDIVTFYGVDIHNISKNDFSSSENFEKGAIDLIKILLNEGFVSRNVIFDVSNMLIKTSNGLEMLKNKTENYIDENIEQEALDYLDWQKYKKEFKQFKALKTIKDGEEIKK